MIAVRVNPSVSKFKKSQPIQVSHIGPGNILNVMIVYVTVGNYDKILDYYTAGAVAKGLEMIAEGTSVANITENGISIQVKLHNSW